MNVVPKSLKTHCAGSVKLIQWKTSNYVNTGFIIESTIDVQCNSHDGRTKIGCLFMNKKLLMTSKWGDIITTKFLLSFHHFVIKVWKHEPNQTAVTGALASGAISIALGINPMALYWRRRRRASRQLCLCTQHKIPFGVLGMASKVQQLKPCRFKAFEKNMFWIWATNVTAQRGLMPQ